MVGDEINITCEIELINAGQNIAVMELEQVLDKDSKTE
jgi:hypothetical protein